MNIIKHFLPCLIATTFLMMNAYANTQDPNAYAFMTGRDMKANALSNISITNHAGQPVTVAGIDIVSVDLDDCSRCFGGVIGGDNMAGTLPSLVTFKDNQTVPIGQNYLYNMIYNVIYFITANFGASPCLLPGCSWPGDISIGRGWCVSMNAISINSNYTYSYYAKPGHPPAKVPPYGDATNSGGFNYKYDLINPTTLGVGNTCFGPIKCNDKTLTCKVDTPQNESFQPYA